MYSIINTSGFIVGSMEKGEADKMLFIFTDKLGFVAAIAQGIRFEKSKLRYYCQDYSFGDFSLVRGKDYYRLTSAQPADYQTVLKVDDPRYELACRVAGLLRRLLQGEESHPELFRVIRESMLDLGGSLSPQDVKCLESVIVYKILFLLGYIENDPRTEYIVNEKISAEMLRKASADIGVINPKINKALKFSHL